jgi:hypothetical protein
MVMLERSLCSFSFSFFFFLTRKVFNDTPSVKSWQTAQQEVCSLFNQCSLEVTFVQKDELSKRSAYNVRKMAESDAVAKLHNKYVNTRNGRAHSSQKTTCSFPDNRITGEVTSCDIMQVHKDLIAILKTRGGIRPRKTTPAKRPPAGEAGDENAAAVAGEEAKVLLQRSHNQHNKHNADAAAT